MSNPVIYFAGSIRGGREDHATYAEIIDRLKRFGRVLTEHVGSADLTDSGEAGSPRAIHDRDLDWVKSSDCIVAEVTMPSLGVGYEIARATQWKKPVLCLFRTGTGKTLSSMISGCPDVMVREYSNVSDTSTIFDDFFAGLRRDGE